MRRRQAVHVELELDEAGRVDLLLGLAQEVALGAGMAGVVDSDNVNLDALAQDRPDLLDAWATGPIGFRKHDDRERSLVELAEPLLLSDRNHRLRCTTARVHGSPRR